MTIFSCGATLSTIPDCQLRCLMSACNQVCMPYPRTSRLLKLFCIALPLLLAAPFNPCFGQDNVTVQELRALRQLIEQQSKSIDLLNRQVSRLSALVEGKAATEGSSSTEFAIPTSPDAPASGGTETVRIEKADGLIRHVVVKGENIVNIAKKHSVSAEDLQKTNRITDPKKLQIGQVLLIPKPASAQPATTPTTTPEPPTNTSQQ